MPLKKGKSAVSANIKEMAHSTNHAKRVSKYGAKKAHEIEVAAAMSAAMPKKKAMGGPLRPR